MSPYGVIRPQWVNTLRLRQNGHHFQVYIFRWISLNKNIWISPKISLKFVPKIRINNIPTSVQIMAWHQTGGWFNIKMSSYQYRKSHREDKTILRPSYLHNGISYTGKTTSLYWIGAQVTIIWSPQCQWSNPKGYGKNLFQLIPTICELFA